MISLSSDDKDSSDHDSLPKRSRKHQDTDEDETASLPTSLSEEESGDLEEHGRSNQLKSAKSNGRLMKIDEEWSRCIVGKSANQHGKTRSGTFLPRKDTDPTPALYFGISRPPELPRLMGDFLEIFETEHHGRGVRTTRGDIPQGTVLFTEHAAIRAPSFTSEDVAEFTKRIRGKVAALPHDQRAAFISLSHASGDDTEETRFARNCFEYHDQAFFDSMAPSFGVGPEHVEGIYMAWLDIAMLNHSCRPNATILIIDPDSGIADLIATVDIPVKGTEITISYLKGADAGIKEDLRA